MPFSCMVDSTKSIKKKYSSVVRILISAEKRERQRKKKLRKGKGNGKEELDGSCRAAGD